MRLTTRFSPSKTLVAALAAIGALVIVTGLIARERAVNSRPAAPNPVFKVPPAPPGVTDLKFGEFFVTPVGPLGLTPAPKLVAMDGKRVRLLGYMVHKDKSPPGRFLFTAMPVQLHDHDSEFADDLPPSVVFVTVPTCRDREVPYQPGLMLITGTLSYGAQPESDGRISLVRLALDPPQPAAQSHGVLQRVRTVFRSSHS